MPTPSFFSHEQEDSRKVIDPEGRVFEPLECGSANPPLWVLVYGEGFFRNRVDPCLGPGWVPEEDSSAQPLERLATWVQGGKSRLKVFTGLDAVYPKSGPYEASEGIYPGYRQRKNWGGQAKEGRE